MTIEPTNKEILGFSISKEEVCLWQNVSYPIFQKDMANIQFQQIVKSGIYKLVSF